MVFMEAIPLVFIILLNPLPLHLFISLIAFIGSKRETHGIVNASHFVFLKTAEDRRGVDCVRIANKLLIVVSVSVHISCSLILPNTSGFPYSVVAMNGPSCVGLGAHESRGEIIGVQTTRVVQLVYELFSICAPNYLQSNDIEHERKYQYEVGVHNS